MRVARLNKDGDWTFGRGRAGYIKRSDAIGQNVVTRLQSFTNDWYLDVDAGIDWLTLLGTRGVTTEQINDEVRRVVLATDGVLRIDELSTKLDRATRKVTITVTITTIYQEQLSLPEVQI